MFELTDQMRIIGLGITVVLSCPIMFICGWMVHKYHILAKAEKQAPKQKTIAPPARTKDDIANEALNLLIKSPSSMPGSANLTAEDD